MKDPSKYGDWAVVTGASSGIGKAFADELSRRGMKIIVVARTLSSLESTAAGVPGDTMVIAADLNDPAAVGQLGEATKDLDVGLVVHSAGIAHVGAFLDTPPGTDEALQAIHIDATVRLARLFGERFSSRGGGGLVLLSSGFGFSPVPYAAVYAAAKSFVISFGEALAEELRGKKVDVLTVIPGGTRTGMATKLGELIDIGKLPMPMGTPEAVAKDGLAALGRRDSVVPGILNKIMALLMTRVMSRGSSKRQVGGMLKSALRIQPS